MNIRGQLLSCFFMAFLTACPARPVDHLIAITNVDVVDVESGSVRKNQTVLVEGDRIIQVEDAGDRPLSRPERVIDGGGRYLIPGLIDMHVHFSIPEQERDLTLYLANGVTTIRNMDASTVPAITAWRGEVAEGRRFGPAIYTTGPTLRRLTSERHVEQIIQSHRAAGYDFIKVYGDIQPDLYAQLMQRAAEEKIPVVGHVPVGVGLEGAIRAGQQTFEHVEDLFQTHFARRTDPGEIPALIALLQGSGSCVVPTLVVFSKVVEHFEQFPHLSGLMAEPSLRYVGPETRRMWHPENNSYVRRGRAEADQMPRIAAAVRQQYEFMQRVVAALHLAGVPLLAGSDANIPHTIPGFSLLEELEILVNEAGFTAADALRSATLTPARCMGRTDELGAVAPGRRADLVLLEADPLADIRNLRRRAGVMASGRWYSEQELRERLEALAVDP